MRNFSFLPNKIREFTIKFYGNTLGLNSRLKHFVVNNDGRCTNCKLNEMGPVYPEETMDHFFWSCNTMANYRVKFLEKCFPELNAYLVVPLNQKGLWYYGCLPENENKNQFITVSLTVFKYVVWRAKLFKRKRGFNSIFMAWVDQMQSIIAAGHALIGEKNKLTYAICRNWDRIGYGRDT